MCFRVKLLIFSLCALLLCGVTSCKTDHTGSNSGGASLSVPSDGGKSSSSSGGSTSAISANDKPLDVMTRAMRAQLDAKSYRAHVTSTISGGAENKMVIEYVAPDRYRMVNESKAGGQNFNQEFIIAGNGTFIKAPNGQWMKSPVDAREMVKAFRDPKMLDELTKTADVKFIGPDTLDGAPMMVYQYTQNNPMGMNLKSTAKTWLSVADGLPRKTETEGEFNGQKTKTLILISDYNADIKIEAPIK